MLQNVRVTAFIVSELLRENQQGGLKLSPTTTQIRVNRKYLITLKMGQEENKLEQNELMNRKHKTICTTLNYTEHFLILASAVTGCISISAFTSLVGVLIEILSSAIGLQICAVAAGIKRYKLVIRKKKKSMIK